MTFQQYGLNPISSDTSSKYFTSLSKVDNFAVNYPQEVTKN